MAIGANRYPWRLNVTASACTEGIVADLLNLRKVRDSVGVGSNLATISKCCDVGFGKNVFGRRVCFRCCGITLLMLLSS